MEVTATALLCLNTSSRLSCEEKKTASNQTAAAHGNTSVVIRSGEAYLRLGQHIEAPGAHLAISGNADQVVGVLGSNHTHTVDGMLSGI